MNRSSDRSKPLVPNGSKEIDLQIDGGKAFPLCESGEMSCTNPRIRNVTQDSTMDRSHGIRMELGLGLHLKGSRSLTNRNQLQPQSLHNGKRELERRLVRWGEGATQKSF